MCGIIGKAGIGEVMPELIKGLEMLEYRGYDSAGIAVIHNEKITRCRESGKIINLREKSESNREELTGNVGIGHTRWATHGKPTVENAHPHISNNKKFALVHNGIIENAEEIKKALLNSEEFYSQTDTEVAVKLISKFYKTDVISAVKTACKELTGTFAFGILCSDFPDKIFATAQGSPLVAVKGATGCWITSDLGAINEKSGEVYRIANGEICEISKDSILFYNSEGEEIKKLPERVSLTEETVNKGGYEHFMLKEIFEQPFAIKKTVLSFADKNSIKLENVNIPDEFFKDKLERIIITACGSAYHTGLIGKHVIEKLCKIPVNVEIASEFRYSEPLINENTLTIFISQSGETADTLAALRLCKKYNAKTLSIVNVKSSIIAKESDNVIFTYAGKEIAVATTKAFSAQLVSLYALAIFIAEKRETISNQKKQKLLNELLSLPDKINTTLLKTTDKAKTLSKKIYKSTDIFFIGRLYDYGTACEGSLKMKEISYINSQSYASGELKHGTISLIENGTPVIAIGSNTEIFSKTASNIAEVKARGAKVFLVTDESEKKLSVFVDDIIYVPSTTPEFQSSLLVIPLQLLSYYTAKRLERDIDKPKNLAKSVTVE
ncbi:MAG: glutamine--fructose-6-phosphate transaminase (isomerizing) [Clostridia bacterium]|nr:glutamine--fructose-6-phosphate transaminase (isomerizing) [Clostridia bacterium]